MTAIKPILNLKTGMMTVKSIQRMDKTRLHVSNELGKKRENTCKEPPLKIQLWHVSDKCALHYQILTVKPKERLLQEFS